MTHQMIDIDMNHRNKTIILLTTLLLTAMAGCGPHDASRAVESPSERSAKASKALLDELVGAPHGWRVLYFPRTDSLLFSDPKKHISENATDEEYIGYGGCFFTMRFDPDGEVHVCSENEPQSEEMKVVTSLYEITQTSLPQLSFKTFNPHIHALSNDRFQGKSDFLLLRNEWDGSLIFKTSKFLTPALEYIIFEKIKHPEETQDKETQDREAHTGISHVADSLTRKAVENRLFFERMKKPEITIRQGDRIFFKSEYPPNESKARMFRKHKYWLFRFPEVPNSIPYEYPLHMTGLGSGYCGTDDGIAFYPGIRFSHDMIFHRFERIEDRFVSEQVRVYAPLYRNYIMAPRHLYPDGEPTDVIAVIEDKAESGI